jgi:propionate CoA-transferase
LKLTPDGIVVSEIADGVELQSNILDQSEFKLIVSPQLKKMDARLFNPAKLGMRLDA